jgi:hypothetical protein
MRSTKLGLRSLSLVNLAGPSAATHSLYVRCFRTCMPSASGLFSRTFFVYRLSASSSNSGRLL